SKKALEEKISGTKERLQSLDVKGEKVVAELEDADQALSKSLVQAGRLGCQREGLENRIAQIQKEIAATSARMESTKKQAQKRLAAYYRLTLSGAAPVVASADSFFGVLVTGKALSRILDADKKLFDLLAVELENMARLMGELRNQQQSVKELESRHLAQSEAIRRQRAEKQRLLEQVRQEEQAAKAALKSLQKALEELTATMSRVQDSAHKGPGFIQSKGRLPLPVPARPKKGDEKRAIFRNGVLFPVAPGTPVRAVETGSVVFSGWFRGYGNMIIIAHGDDYYSICAQMEDLFKQKGEPVERGEVIATVGDTGTLPEPGLYFELRHHKEPLDPLQWLRKESF
ncbi:MAG: peptidoglycan DD-metalloendopeptidase family protein, partial [Desulfatibacillaceae bacterium]|nr:peptidoglycan DD-metalloendopeptidase family protein [Desulfatibacillaceae bacterium]